MVAAITCEAIALLLQQVKPLAQRLLVTLTVIPLFRARVLIQPPELAQAHPCCPNVFTAH